MKCSAYNRNSPNGQFEFIENIEQGEWKGKWNYDIIWYDIIKNCRTLSLKQVRKACNLAMTTWDVEIAVQFKPYWDDRTGTARKDITIDFKSKSEDPYFAEKPSVLAYAYFPAQGTFDGKIVFNNDYIWSMDGKSITVQKAVNEGWINDASNPNNLLKTYNIIHVLVHELGHSLGLTHDVSGNSDGRDVMDAYYSGILELSDRDISRILLKYPKRIFSRWENYKRIKDALKIIKNRF